MTTKSTYKIHGKRVYGILLENYENELPGMTRGEIEAEVRKSFRSNWGQVIKEARRLAIEDDLIIPRVTKEAGWVYEVTNDPNKVVPGLLAGVRQTHGMRESAFADREFIRKREAELNRDVNGAAFVLANIAMDAEDVARRASMAVQGHLADAMVDRRNKKENK